MIEALMPASGAVCATLDLVEIGPVARLENLTLADLDQCRHALAIAGVLDARRSAARGPGWLVLNLSCEIDAVTATGIAELNIVPAGKSAYQITQRSTLRLNPLKYLAECYTSPLKVTYDGSTNYIGPTPLDSRYMLVQQYQYVAAMLGELSRRLGDALPDHVVSTEENVRLRRIELCRDRATANSRGAAILLSHSVLRETRRVGRDVYSAGSTDDDGLPVTRWWRKRKGVAHKVYAKAPKDVGGSGCVREEVSCQGHTALQELDCVSRAEWTSEGVTELLTGFVEAALPILNTLHAHVTAVMAGSATPADLFVALSPLVMAMSGAPTGGRPTSPEQVAQLRSAFDSIVLTGQYRGKGLKKGLTLRSLFDALCDPKGPLEKNPLLCLYTLKPQFARASHAMMQAVDHGVRKG